MTGQAAENRRRIFISHSERDAFVAERFEHLLAKITAQDLECFVASKAIRCGREWFPRLNQALSETSALVAPLTPASLSSSWVPYEVGFAYAHKRPAFGIALGISLQQAQRGPYAAIPFSPHREEPLAAAVSEICSTLGIQPDVALVRREVGKFNDEIRQHIEASVDRYAEVEQVHSAGVVDHLVPTLAGFIGDDEAYVSAYFTRRHRGPLNTQALRRLDDETLSDVIRSLDFLPAMNPPFGPSRTSSTGAHPLLPL